MTGALEVGAKFSGADIRTLVSAKPAAPSAAHVIVFDTETRDASAELAAFVSQWGGVRPHSALHRAQLISLDKES